MGGGWQAHRLDKRPERGRPRLVQLQQGNVIVERVCVVILVHHDPLDVRHIFGTALHQHAEVSAPVTWVREPERESEVKGQTRCVVDDAVSN